MSIYEGKLRRVVERERLGHSLPLSESLMKPYNVPRAHQWDGPQGVYKVTGWTNGPTTLSTWDILEALLTPRPT